MQGSLLVSRLQQLESDLLAEPPRISAYTELPCALFQYEPNLEWELRSELRKLQTRLENSGKRVHLVSFGDLLWSAITKSESIDAVADLERTEGWVRAQEQLNIYLSDRDFADLPSALAALTQAWSASKDILFLWRAGALAPGIYLLSKLIDELKGRITVPTILYFPGTINQDGLRFMGLSGRETTSNYRAKIYH
jgi:hypothetical protein